MRTEEFRVTAIEQLPQIQLEMIKALYRKQGKDVSFYDGVKADYKCPKDYMPILHV